MSALILNRRECRAVDQYAIHTLGIPGLVLMENAGRNAAEWIDTRCRPESDQSRSPSGAIVCGKGNNAGDGFVIARHLLRSGWSITIYLASDPATLQGDALINYAPLAKLGIECVRIDAANQSILDLEWNRCDVVVDALLGTGFEGQVREPMASIIPKINRLDRPVIVAIDVPSGLDADTGLPGGTAIEADYTCTFLARKPGFEQPGASQWTGEISIFDIGVPAGLIVQRVRASS